MIERKKLNPGEAIWVPSRYATVLSHDTTEDVVKVRYGNGTVGIYQRGQVVAAQQHWDEARRAR